MLWSGPSGPVADSRSVAKTSTAEILCKFVRPKGRIEKTEERRTKMVRKKAYGVR